MPCRSGVDAPRLLECDAGLLVDVWCAAVEDAELAQVLIDPRDAQPFLRERLGQPGREGRLARAFGTDDRDDLAHAANARRRQARSPATDITMKIA